MISENDPIFLEILRETEEANLLDDDYARIFFTDNIECVQKMLQIIMEKPFLQVKNSDVQQDIDGPDGSRSIRLDVYAVDSDGTQYDIEIQNKPSGAVPQRARLNSAMLDVHSLKPG